MGQVPLLSAPLGAGADSKSIPFESACTQLMSKYLRRSIDRSDRLGTVAVAPLSASLLCA